MGNDGNVGARVGGRVGDTSVWVDVERRKSSNIAAAFDEALRLQRLAKAALPYITSYNISRRAEFFVPV